MGCALEAQEKAAQQQLSNVCFETGDMDVLELPAGAFDAALCSNGMVYCQSVGGALCCISRCLRPGGRLVFNTPMAHPWPGPGPQSSNLACGASKYPTSAYEPSCLVFIMPMGSSLNLHPRMHWGLCAREPFLSA